MTSTKENKREKNGKNNDDQPEDRRLNKYQQMHLDGAIDVYAPIPQEHGEPLPPLAVQWKEDYRRRYGKNTGNR